MVRVTLKEDRKHPSSCANEDGLEAPWRKTQVEMEGHYRKGYESLEAQGITGQGEMERFLQYPLLHTELAAKGDIRMLRNAMGVEGIRISSE